MFYFFMYWYDFFHILLSLWQNFGSLEYVMYVCMGEWMGGNVDGWMPVCIYACMYVHMMYENDYKLILKN